MEVRKVECVFSAESVTVADATFRTPDDVVNLLRNEILKFPDEHGFIVMVNAKNRMLHYEDMSHGGLTSCLTAPRNVFRSAIIFNAASLLFAHNHPSGDPTPSSEDIALAIRLKDAGELLGIRLLDSIVIASSGFISLKARGII
jgi:DNA repair protein RadC